MFVYEEEEIPILLFYKKSRIKMLSKHNFLLIFAALAITMEACTKEPTPSAQNPDKENGTSITEINGTKILKGKNLVGLISDENGKGIPDVPVSDGFTFTATDENGVYQMTANHYCRKVYFTLPSEFEVPLDDETKMPLFYSTRPINRKNVNRNDFKLKRLEKPMENFTLIAIGDPQCKTDSDVVRFKDETMTDINQTLISEQSNGKYPNAYGLTLGDITFDNVVQWEPMVKSMSKVEIGDNNYLPIFNCIGNHDHNAAEPNDFKATNLYVENFGPTDYSFNRGKAHIIVMDNVVCTKNKTNTWEYGGGYSELQMEWLKQDLEFVKDKEDKIIFFASHIPFRDGTTVDNGANVNKSRHYEDILTLLEQFKEAHLLIGHTHYHANYIHRRHVCKGGNPVYEHIHGAACGAWWCSNLNVDGTPNGYTFYDIRGNQVYNWVTKGTRLPENYQMRVYNGNELYTGSKNYEYTWYYGGIGGSKNIKAYGNEALRNCFVAKIWNSDPTWKVELTVNGKTYPMKHLAPIADMCAVSFFFNELNKNTTTWTKALDHYWYCEAPCGDPSKEKDWEVRATQIIPGSNTVNTYSSTAFQSDYSGFAIGSL